MGAKCEIIHELTNRHKIIQLTQKLAQKNRNVVGNE